MSKHHHHDAPKDSYDFPVATWEKGRNLLLALFVISWVAALAGFSVDPKQFFPSYLVAFFFGAGIVIGSALFIMIQHLTGSAWSVPLRRLMENIMMSMPILALLFIPVAFGLHELYEWSHADVVAKDALLLKKSAFLNPTAFYIRAVFYFAIWSYWAWRLSSWSRAQDKSKDLNLTFKSERISAPGMLLFFLSASLASVDWVMSLQPHWYSTIFGIYCMAGGMWAFFAILTFTLLRLRASGILANSVTIEHYHDMGKWMFALTVFWAYIAFSQYMLIWYANMPEETSFFMVRRSGTWEMVSAVLLFGHFAATFLILLARASKRSLNVLRFVTVWILCMHYVDVYWLVMPNFSKAGISPHWMDLACFAAVMSTLALGFWWRLRSAPIMPIGDPRFQKGLEFQNV